MAKLRLSVDADADLAAIWRWSAEHHGPDEAEAYLLAFDKVFSLLRRYPEAGSLRHDVQPPVRSFACLSHRVFYAIDDTGVLIVRVLHKRMSMDARLG